MMEEESKIASISNSTGELKEAMPTGTTGNTNTNPYKDQHEQRYYILDTGAFISAGPGIIGTKIAGFDGDNGSVELLTIEEVSKEVRDKEARKQLKLEGAHSSKSTYSNFNCDLDIRKPSPESISKVVNFAKKTGDYTALSVTDLKVLALAYTIHAELLGTANLREDPPVNENKGRKKRRNRKKKQPVANSTSSTCCGDEVKELDKISKNEAFKSIPEDINPVSNEEEDGEGEWITSETFEKILGSTLGDTVTLKKFDVACVTGDFAMQNVCMQMGMKVVSPDGKLITHLRKWILTCYGCDTLIRDMDKLFCPECGNTTLIRKSMHTNADGTVFISKLKFTPTTRGSQFSIPKPKGGRQEKFIYVEDQILNKIKAAKKHEKKLNQMSFDDDGDYDAENILSRRTEKVLALKDVKIGYGRRNPNVPKKKIGKKNKPRSTGKY